MSKKKREPKEFDIDPETGEQLHFPYCGGCGHRYFNLRLRPLSQARIGPCHWCIRDKEEEEKNPTNLHLPEQDSDYDPYADPDWEGYYDY